MVIVGASVAGYRAAEGLRAEGFDGEITMIGAEDLLPYDRPPLSKEVLTAEVLPTVDIADPGWYSEHGITLMLGRPATGVDPEAQEILVGETHIRYDELIIATGARPRNPFDALPSGVITLRTLDDALHLRSALGRAQNVAVIGGGFIGLEVASAVRSRGAETTVIEAADIPLGRNLGPEAAHRVGDIARGAGVHLRCGVGVQGFLGETHLSGLQLSDGSVVDCDLAVLGIGAIPNTEWLEGSGLRIERLGLICDANGRAADRIWGVGDVSTWENHAGEPERHEHWTNAHQQAQVVVKNLLDGGHRRIESADYIWSDQFGHRLTIVGNTSLYDQISVHHPKDGSLTVLYARDGFLTGACIVDQPRLAVQCRRWVAQNTSVRQIPEWRGEVLAVS
ncbi:FAD-dependent oxidoreductase [Leucobacter sp. M11]|nr:FAD-dependent oxidoreductase [Leucobacter sp. M11]